MTSLLTHSRLTGLALALALGLTMVPGLIAPLLTDEFADWLPGVDIALADHSQGSGG